MKLSLRKSFRITGVPDRGMRTQQGLRLLDLVPERRTRKAKAGKSGMPRVKAKTRQMNLHLLPTLSRTTFRSRTCLSHRVLLPKCTHQLRSVLLRQPLRLQASRRLLQLFDNNPLLRPWPRDRILHLLVVFQLLQLRLRSRGARDPRVLLALRPVQYRTPTNMHLVNIFQVPFWRYPGLLIS